MSIGKIGQFDISADSWNLYTERLEQYFLANAVKNELKVPTLITVMGGEAYELLVNLCTPQKPATLAYEALVKVMAEHLQPKPSMLAERYKFRLRKQEPGEDVATFVAALKKMSRYCEFEKVLDDSLRDQFVCGIRSDYIRQRLFAEEKLTFSQAHKLATTLETAEKDSAAVEESTQSTGMRKEVGTAGCYAVATTRPTQQRGSSGRQQQRRRKQYETDSAITTNDGMRSTSSGPFRQRDSGANGSAASGSRQNETNVNVRRRASHSGT